MKVHDVQVELEDGVKTLIERGDFRAYLDFMATFHRYSPTNVMLILSQFPDATIVAGFRAWKEKGRHVKRGEKGIHIIVPMVGKKRKDDEDDPPIRFGVGYVFDVSQTEGAEVPDFDVPDLVGEDDRTAAAFATLLRVSESYGLSFRYDPIRDTAAMGYYSASSKEVVIRDSLGTGLQAVKTFAHELAHSQTPDLKETFRDEREAIAEGAAYIVCKLAFGLDTSERSFPYIAHWIKDYDVFMATMGVVRAVSRKMIDDIEQIGGLHVLEETA